MSTPQAQSKQIPQNKFIPVIADIRVSLYKADTLRNGLELYYPNRRYAVPAKLRFIVDPELDLTKPVEALARISVKPAKLTKYYTEPVDVLNIELIKPRPVLKTKPELRMIAVGFDCKSTFKTSAFSSIDIEEGAEYLIWQTREESGSGAHWRNYYVFLAPLDAKIIAVEKSRSNRGNYSEEVIDIVNNRRVDRYEELEVLIHWDWGRVIRMRDNLEDREFEALVLEYHNARKTVAYTSHDIEPRGNAILLYTTKTALDPKTHWTEVYEIVEKPLTIKTTRISNSGKETVTEVRVE